MSNAILPFSSPNEKLGWYWWFRGKYLSQVPDTFRPSSNDTLEQIAWSSIKYDHLGGPNTQHVLLTHLKPGELRNPNRAWDMSSTASTIMKRIFHYENVLHLITVLLHLLVLFPLTGTYLVTSSRSGNQYGTVQFLINRLIQRYQQQRH
jgi:hypothetical protein